MLYLRNVVSNGDLERLLKVIFAAGKFTRHISRKNTAYEVNDHKLCVSYYTNNIRPWKDCSESQSHIISRKPCKTEM